jgi:hypothetical protein
MAESTGPVVATALIAYGNAVLLNNQDPFAEVRVLVAAGIAGGALFLVEQWSPTVARSIGYLMLGTVLATRVDPNVPNPVESLLTWWRGGPGRSTARRLPART